ncbi:MAG: hypothetical protein Q9163_001914 [Psora crenata]
MDGIHVPVNQFKPEEALNHRVISRHLPFLSAVLSRTHYSVIYTFSPSTSSWEKTGVEGTLFVVSLHPLPGTSSPRYALVILNRRGLNNWILELKNADGVQVTEEYIILQGQGIVKDTADGEVGLEEEEEKIWGIWVFEEEVGSTRGQRAACADWVIKCANWAEGGVAEGENSAGSNIREVNVDSWADGVRRDESTSTDGFNDNAAEDQQPARSPDLLALLNKGRGQDQDRGPPLAVQDLNAGRDIKHELFRRAGENLKS